MDDTIAAILKDPEMQPATLAAQVVIAAVKIGTVAACLKKDIDLDRMIRNLERELQLVGDAEILIEDPAEAKRLRVAEKRMNRALVLARAARALVEAWEKANAKE